MKSFLYELLKEGGTVSSTRFMAILSLITAIILAFYGLSKGLDPLALSGLIGSFIVPAFGMKVMQKRLENGTSKSLEVTEEAK